MVLRVKSVGTSRSKTLTPINHAAFWVGPHARNYPKGIIELYFDVVTPRDFSQSAHFRRPPRTEHPRELMYWRQQLYLEVQQEPLDRTTAKNRFEDPQYWISQIGFRNMGKNSNTFRRNLR